jgi:predicted MFS family arabinose efflux permease
MLVSSPAHSAVFFRQLIVGLTAFLTVVDLFAAQALLPSLTAHYQVSPAAMGLAVNACTLGMAAGGLAVAFLSQNIDRRRGVLASLSALSVPTLLLAVAPDIWTFALLRITQGIFMSAAFGLTLAYLGERFDMHEAAGAFAAYITGNVASNLLGRLIAAATVQEAGLAASFAVFAVLNLAGAALVYRTMERLPQQPELPAAGQTMTMETWRSHLSDPRLRPAFGIGFCILFAFISTFTYINFVLVNPPLLVSMMQLGVIYFVFLPSILTTPVAGHVQERFGLHASLAGGLGVALVGLPLLLSAQLTAVLAGMALVAAGTFFAQAIATGYVSRTATANRGAASGIYLAAYFSGGLAGSAVIGQLFDRLGWSAAVAGIGASLVIAIYLVRRLK